jgi:ADP-ribosylglycohydrolase
MTHREKCIGTLLGCAFGDALGSNLEFKTAEEIASTYGTVTRYVSGRRPLGMFTDDTEAAIAVAWSLAVNKRLHIEAVNRAYLKFWKEEPRRDYGPNVENIYRILDSGMHPVNTARLVYPEGSYGNGALLRVIPVGLAFRNASENIFRIAVNETIVSTHDNKVSKEFAYAYAKLIGSLSSEYEYGYTLEKLNLLLSKIYHNMSSSSEVFREIIVTIQNPATTLPDILKEFCKPNEYGKYFQIDVVSAFATALFCFARNLRNSMGAVCQAVNGGGDADSVGALTGALCGSLCGINTGLDDGEDTYWPYCWFSELENAPGVGRDFIIRVAEELATLDLKEVNY